MVGGILPSSVVGAGGSGRSVAETATFAKLKTIPSSKIEVITIRFIANIPSKDLFYRQYYLEAVPQTQVNIMAGKLRINSGPKFRICCRQITILQIYGDIFVNGIAHSHT